MDGVSSSTLPESLSIACGRLVSRKVGGRAEGTVMCGFSSWD